MDSDALKAPEDTATAFHNRQAITVAATAAAVFLAAAVPWGTFDIGRAISSEGAQFSQSAPQEFNEGLNQILRSFGSVAVTMFNGHATVGSIELPNILVLFAAVGAAIAAWLGAYAQKDIPLSLPIALAAYGLLHSLYVLYYLFTSPGSTVGAGVVIATAAFAAMLYALLRPTPQA